MEISKILTVSTAHINKSTRELLDQDVYEAWQVIAYPKGDYGWFIYAVEAGGAPPDLAMAMQYVKQNGCDWLCLDQDGPIEDLPIYEW